MKKILVLVFSVLVVCMLCGSASALQLTLSSGASTFTVNDADADGVVFYFGAVGSWGVNITGGTSTPALSSPYPHMDLNSINTNNSLPAADLTIRLSDLWSEDVPAVINAIGGSIGTGMSAIFNLYLDGGLQDTFGPFGTKGAFKIDAVTLLPAITSDYTLLMEAIISATTTGNPTSFNWELTAPAVPEPATMLLIGSGLIGLAGLGRKKFFKKA